MRQSKYITIITMACALFFASCSDEYMENMNTDPFQGRYHRPECAAHHCPTANVRRP